MTRPTNLELMAYADGELEPEREKEVARWLEEHPDDHQFLNELSNLSVYVQEFAPAVGSFDVSEQVMAALENDIQSQSDHQDNIEQIGPHSGLRVISSATRARNDNESSDAQDLTPGAKVQPGTPIWLYAALGIAAAAALFLWIKGTATEPKTVQLPASTAVMSGAKTAALSAPTPHHSVAAVNSKIPDTSPGEPTSQPTEIDYIDFGSHNGAVFFVEGSSPKPTTVVWITDEETSP
jgi:anti-sigma factor RsiW